MAGTNVDEGSRLELLLGDARDLFDGLVSDRDRISSAHLIEKLCEIVPRPWAEYGRERQTAHSRTSSPVCSSLWGSCRRSFASGPRPRAGTTAASSRRLGSAISPRQGAFETSNTSTNADETGTSDTFQSCNNSKAMLRFENREKSNNDGLCLGVEVGRGELGERTRAKGGNGLPPGLSPRTITELAEAYSERAYANAQETGGDTKTATLDADLRRRLAEIVLPEHIEVEISKGDGRGIPRLGQCDRAGRPPATRREDRS